MTIADLYDQLHSIGAHTCAEWLFADQLERDDDAMVAADDAYSWDRDSWGERDDD